MKQITVVVDDHPGVVADITRLLAERDIRIDAMVGDTAKSHGVVTLTVDRYDEALSALRDAGFQAISEDALVLRLEDAPGALARASARLARAGINIRSMRILRREGDSMLVSLVTGENERARELVADVLAGPSIYPPPPS